jgi:hypothetical protein
MRAIHSAADPFSIGYSKSEAIVHNQHGRALIFIDPGIESPFALAYAAQSRAELIFLSGKQDGLDQIVRFLNQRGKLASLHLMTQLSQGRLALCGAMLGLREVKERAPELARIGSSVMAAGKVMIGAGGGQDGPGGRFLQVLEECVGAPVSLWRSEAGVACP